MANDIGIRVAVTSTGESVISNTGKQLDQLKDKTESFASSMGKMAAAMGIGMTAADLFQRAIRLIPDTINKVIDAAKEQEDVLMRLRSATELSGANWDDLGGKFEDFTTQLMNMTRFSDDDLQNAMQRIISLSGDTKNAMEATKLAADMASSGLFDLDTSSRMVAMAMQGQLMMLGRYIPALKETALQEKGITTETQKAEYAFKLLTERFGGMSEKAVSTYGGKVDQLKNSVGELSEAVGNYLLPGLSTAAGIFAEIAKSITGALIPIKEMKIIRDETQGIIMLANALSQASAQGIEYRMTMIEAFISGKSGIGIFAPLVGILNELTKSYTGGKISLSEYLERTNALQKQLELSKEEMDAVVYATTNMNRDTAEAELKMYGLDTSLRTASIGWRMFLTEMEKYGTLAIKFKPIESLDFLTDFWGDIKLQKTTIYDVLGGDEAFEKVITVAERATATIKATWDSAFASMADSQNTWEKTGENMWMTFKKTALQNIGEILWAQLTANTKSLASNIASAASYIATNAAKAASAIAAAAAAIYHAAAELFEAHSWIPFAGVAIAGGFLGYMLAQLNPLKRAMGGLVYGQEGEDRVPMMATAGEYVLNRGAVSRIGLSNLEGLNSGGGSYSSSTSNSYDNRKSDVFNIYANNGADIIETIQRAIATRRLRLA